MKNLILIVSLNVVALAVVLSTVMFSKKEEPKVKIVLPNDWKRITKFEGDPSLLSAYVRNDSLFLNFEAY